MWREFSKDKKYKKDISIFSLNLFENLNDLHQDLKNKTYRHGGYEYFIVNDPKKRDIHKASVRDRIVHHILVQALYPYFDKKFIYDSYSCRIGKGTHKAIYRFDKFQRKVSKNNTKTCWVLKCDIRKFFANIDHDVLKKILKKNIEDKDVLYLLSEIIDSFNIKTDKTVSLFTMVKNDTNMNTHISDSVYMHNIFFTRQDLPENMSTMVDIKEVGLPLGNLTSQLLVNIYMNEFDQFVKHRLKVKYYIRYADDFVILQNDKIILLDILKQMKKFLENNLKLNMHPDKVFIKTIFSGVDFLGWVQFPKHRVLRTSTKSRMSRNIGKNQKPNTVISYLGMLKHGNTSKLREKIISLYKYHFLIY
ncbi:MAG: reverse transcriptase/maturase family protein [bacterium]